jgi:predicted metal-dependent hydrolase
MQAGMTSLVRTPRFDLTRTPPHWCPGSPEFSHTSNGFFLLLPIIEPYLVRNMEEAAGVVRDPVRRRLVDRFAQQEASHAQHHREYTVRLKQHYPELAALEAQLHARLERHARQRSLLARLAFTAGFEALTYHLTCYLVSSGSHWLADADPEVASMLAWHGAEEVEHKSAAFDLYQALGGGYFWRVRGLLEALHSSARDVGAASRQMLTSDGLWGDNASKRRMLELRRSLARGLVPRFATYLLPNYHPSKHRDPPELERLLADRQQDRDQHRLSPTTAPSASPRSGQ